MTGYYDAILGLIPLALLGGYSTLSLTGLESSMAITVAALAAVALMGHAMFVNGPVDAAPSTRDAGNSAGNSPGYRGAD